MVNSENKNNSSSWSSFGLGIQDSDGAVRRELVDLDTTQAAVDFAVDFSLHRKADEEVLDQIPLPELDVHTVTRIELFGHCKQSKHHALAKCFAKTFAQLMITKKLPTGTLVGFKSVQDGAGSSKDPVATVHYFFTGVLRRKPLCHILVKAWPCDSHVSSGSSFSLVDTKSASHKRKPTFATSHDSFLNMVEECDGHLKGIAVSVFPTKFEFDVWRAKALQVSTVGTPVEHMMKSGSVPLNQKVQVQLPFGLKPEPKKRALPKRKQKPRKKKVSEPKVSLRFAVQSSDSDLDSSEQSIAGFEGDNHSDNGDVDVENFDLGPGMNVRGEDSEAAEESDGSEEIAQDCVPPTDVAAAEAVSAHSAFLDYEEDANDKAFVVEMVASAQTEQPRQQPVTFFHKSIGFSKASIAPTGRSRCYHCEQMVPEGTVRYVYHWSISRPERYIHGSCVTSFVSAKLEDRKAQAIQAIRHIIDQNEDLTVKNSAVIVLGELRNL